MIQILYTKIKKYENKELEIKWIRNYHKNQNQERKINVGKKDGKKKKRR